MGAAFAASQLARIPRPPKFDASLGLGFPRRCGDMANLTSDQLEEIREAFKLFDTDDSGTIDSDGAFFSPCFSEPLRYMHTAGAVLTVFPFFLSLPALRMQS